MLKFVSLSFSLLSRSLDIGIITVLLFCVYFTICQPAKAAAFLRAQRTRLLSQANYLCAPGYTSAISVHSATEKFSVNKIEEVLQPYMYTIIWMQLRNFPCKRPIYTTLDFWYTARMKMVRESILSVCSYYLFTRSEHASCAQT